jgi:UDP-N-acetylmuramate--alanine ligase
VNVAEVVKDIPAKIVNYQDFFDQDIQLRVPGLHNKKNAAAAFAVSSLLAVLYTDTRASLLEFPGTWRRFEYKGKLLTGALLYDDYAHHPKEIVATLEGFRELYPKNDSWKITVVFQPHLFSRTKLLFDDFVQSFSLSDQVILLPIYHAREEDDGTISSERLAEAIRKEDLKSVAFPDFEKAEHFLREQVFSGKDIIVTMGAGEAFKIGDNLLKGNF